MQERALTPTLSREWERGNSGQLPPFSRLREKVPKADEGASCLSRGTRC